jgi:nucleoside-diphosphate-sugar epimerase
MDLAIRLRDLFCEKELKIIKKTRSLKSVYLESKITINTPDIKKVRALGWFPKIAIEEGFLRTIRSFYELDCVQG